MWYALPERIPESDETAGAIADTPSLSMEAYSRFARRFLALNYRRLCAEVLGALADRPRARILEIGSGPGWISIEIARGLPQAELVGLELSPDMVRVAEANRAAAGVQNLRFVEGDAAHMTALGDASFDAVISNGSMHHWLDVGAVLDEVARVLRPGGRAFLCDGRRDVGLPGALFFALFSSLFALDRTIPWRLMRRYWRTSIQAGYTPRELRQMLERSRLKGWSIAESRMNLLVRV